MASSDRFKESECPYPCTSFPYVHYKLISKLYPKRRLRIQNSSAGCVLSRTYPSQQQEIYQVRLREQGVPVSGATPQSKHSPSGFYPYGAHGDRLSSPSGDLGDTISRPPPGPPTFTPTSGSAYKYARPSRLYPRQKEIRAGPDSGSPVSRNTLTSGRSFPSRVQSLGDSCLHTPSILHHVLTYSPCFYMFPPLPLLNKVIQKLRTTQAAEVILIAPWWPKQSWFPHLLRLCVEHPLAFNLPSRSSVPAGSEVCLGGKSYHLHAWRLSCDNIKHQVFQTSSLGSRQPLGGPQPIACTTTGGFASFDGPQVKVLTRLTPQLLR